MPTKFLLIIRTEEPSNVDLYRDPGNTEGPVIDVIRNSLLNFGISLSVAEYLPAPENFPPWFVIRAVLSEDVGKDDVQNLVSEGWQNSDYPPADVNVEDDE